MPTSQELVHAGLADRMRQQYSRHRSALEAAQSDITKYVQEHTADEQKAFEAAAAALQAKRRALLQKRELQAKRRRAEEAHDGMREVEHQLADLQRKAYRKIRNMDLPDERKRELAEEVERGIERVLYSDDELRAVAELRSQIKRSLAAGGAAAGGAAPMVMLCG